MFAICFFVQQAMGDDSPTHDYSPDFSFNPTPQGMSPDQLYGFFSSMTPEQRAMAQTYWSGGAGTSTPPSGITTAIPTPTGTTAAPTPHTTQPSTPLISRSTTSSHRRRSHSRSSGGGCCGGSATDASTPPHERPSLSSVDSTPMGSPSTPWGAHDHDNSKIYTIRDGAPIMNSAGKAMKTRIRQLCTVQFHNSVMTLWEHQDKEKKNYINTKIKQEFQPSDPRNPVSNEWIQYTARILMAHRRSEARDAFREGKEKPMWLDDREWEGISQDLTKTPDRFQQQREAARTRLQTVGASHLGSGAYETMRHEFVSIGSKFFYLNVCLWAKL